MRVKITERHCSVPAEVLERTEEQVRSLSKFEPRATAADVVYEEEKKVRKFEILIHVDGDEAVVAHGTGAEFRSALDQGVDRVSRRLRRQRERRRDHKAPPLSEGNASE